MYFESEEFLSGREYEVCPLRDENGRRVIDKKTREPVFTSKRITIDQSQVPGCVNLDYIPDFQEKTETAVVDGVNVLYRRVREERDENPYEQAKRIKREQGAGRKPYPLYPKTRRSYLD